MLGFYYFYNASTLPIDFILGLDATMSAFFNENQLHLLNQKSPLPLYHKLHQLLRQAIQDEAIGTGKRLPTEKQLQQETGFSRVTVKRALDELAIEGLVQRRRGVGTVVSYAPPPMKAVNAPLVAMLENLEQMGRNTQVQVISVKSTVPPENIKMLFEPEINKSLLHLIRTRSQNSRVFGYYESWTDIPNVSPDAARFSQTSRLQIFREAGVVFIKVKQSLKAVVATPTIAAYLNVLTGTPLTYLVRFSYDSEGRLRDYLKASYNPELFEYQMVLNLA